MRRSAFTAALASIPIGSAATRAIAQTQVVGASDPVAIPSTTPS